SRLDAAGLGRTGVRRAADLARLPLTTLSEVDDPSTLVLRPDETSIQRYGGPAMVARVVWAKVRGRQGLINREHIEPEFKPVHWHVQDGMTIGYSHHDLDRLADLGRRWLELAGVRPHDVV